MDVINSSDTSRERSCSCPPRKQVGAAVQTFGRTITSYYGSKTWSLPGIILRFPIASYRRLRGQSESFADELFCRKGYHYLRHVELSPESASSYLVFAAAAAATQTNKFRWMEPFGYTMVEKHYHEETGLKVVIFQRGDHLLLSFGAMGSHHAEYENPREASAHDSQFNRAALHALTGGIPAMYDDALAFVDRILERYPNVTLTGQCLGASLAQYVSLMREVPCICLNSMPLGSGLQRELGQERLARAEELIQQVSTTGDFFSALPRSYGIIDAFSNVTGLRTPGNFGLRYRVDSIYKKAMDTHQFILGSLFSHWKPEYTELCKDLNARSKEVAEALTKEIQAAADGFKQTATAEGTVHCC